MSSRGIITPNRVIAAVLLAAIVAAFAPTRFLRVANAPARVLERLTAPVGAGVRLVGNWVSEPEPPDHPDAILGRIQELETLLRRSELIIQDQAAQIQALQSGSTVSADRVTLIAGRVFGGAIDPSGRLLSVRLGARDGVERGAVATVRGQHMLGLVTEVSETFCRVTPIDDRNAGPIEVIVYPDDGGEGGVRFDVAPNGDGTLSGPGRFVTIGPEQIPRTVRVGQIAYLSDPSLAPHWGLQVGRVESAQTDEDSPLRQVITIRPEIDTRHVAGVVIRVPLLAGDGGAL
ncbi:MAG: rod shape-determining protein MreC [Phycisphaerales bacterium]